MKKQLFALLLATVMTAPAWAIPAITAPTGGSNFDIFYGGSTGDVVGFAFTADQNLTVSALGVWGDGHAGGDGVLDSAHDVGLWTIGGTLLASTTVDATGALVDGFYYSAIGAVNLTAGDEYVLGALYTSTDNDQYLSNAIFTTNDISMTEGRFPDAGSLGFVFPNSNSPGNPGRVGPNMMIERTPTGAPEPGSLLLIGLGLTGLVAVRRRRS